MRIGLIAALRRSEDGTLRAALPLAGQSVLARQAALLQSLGAERVVCLVQQTGGDILDLQHVLEAQGMQFHALKGFAALPALVRAEDDLIILLDGLVPDLDLGRAAIGGQGESVGGGQRAVATIPADHPLAVAHPEDFERIDAARHWAGVLAMRGAPVQQLADFPADADAVSVLLRLALQAGTPTCDLAARGLVPGNWWLAGSSAETARQEAAMIARAASPTDWRAPSAALALSLVRQVVPRGLVQGGPVAGGIAVALLLAAVLVAALGFSAAGIGLAGIGAFAAQVSRTFTAFKIRLRSAGQAEPSDAVLAAAVDLSASLVLWFALTPWPQWQPLAVLGAVTLGLARLAARLPDSALGVAAADRASLLLLLAVAAALGLLPEILACLALGLLAALLLRRAKD